MLPPALAPFGLWIGGIVDVFLGALLLVGWRVRLIGGLQLAVIGIYVVLLTLVLPDLWADPLGPLLKTLPLALATLVMIVLEAER